MTSCAASSFFAKLSLLPLLGLCLLSPLSAQNTSQNLPSVIAPTDLLSCYQEHGKPQLNLSLSGKTLSVAGKEFKEGFGTHANSMIAISIPAKARFLSGACGVDDNAGGGSVVFQVLSGSEVLWSSPIKKSGEAASSFCLALPQGTQKLYLRADKTADGNSNDHANWLDLRWQSTPPATLSTPLLSDTEKEENALLNKHLKKTKNGYVFNAAHFGILPSEDPQKISDNGPKLRRLLSLLRPHEKVTLTLPKGTYHFSPEGALPMSFHISNHDQPDSHPILIPLVDLHNFTLDGQGSTFIIHGKALPLLIKDSTKVSLKNIAVDWVKPFYSDLKLTKVEDDAVEGTFPSSVDYEVQNGRLIFKGENWQNSPHTAIAFEEKTGHIVAGTSDIGGIGKTTDLGNHQVRIEWKLKQQHIQPGTTLTLRSWERPHPACVIYRATDTSLKNVGLHCSWGMTLLAQRSTNIHLDGLRIVQREKGYGINPKERRAYSASADATHFSNTAGLILSENGVYDGMMDDAINVHSTCLGIEEVLSEKSLKCSYKHGQAVGFEVFLPGEKLRFIAGPTLENKEEYTVARVEKLSTKEVIIHFDQEMPSYVQAGGAVENATYQPAVTFRHNKVSNNRARGALFTTPKKILVENNTFAHVAGSAILLAGDAQGWYESGACLDVVIRKNTFINNLTSRFQFTNAIISLYPEVRQLDKQEAYYHRNILITDNVFKTFDVPLLFAISSENVSFCKNRIEYNQDFKGWGQKPFEFLRCKNIFIYDNKVSPERNFTLSDCQLKQTAPESLFFAPPKK